MWFIRRLFKEPNIYDIQFCGLYDRKKYLGVFTRKELRRELAKLQEIIDEIPIEMQREIEKKLIAKSLGIEVEQLDEKMMDIYEVDTFFVGSEMALKRIQRRLKKVDVKITKKDLKRLIYIYENCNILKPEVIRNYLKPTIDKVYEAFYKYFGRDDNNETTNR